MKLNNDLTGIFASKARIAMLRHILNPGFSSTGRELARLCGLSHTQAVRILRDFEAVNLVQSFRAGNSYVWRGRTSSYAYKAAEQVCGKPQDRVPLEGLKRVILERLRGTGAVKAVIFGSVADKRENESSDIDLFLLAKDSRAKTRVEKAADGARAECLELFGNTLNYYILDMEEYGCKKNTRLLENIEGGIVVYDEADQDKNG